MSSQAPADWYPDPFGRFKTRYWDGQAWTERVATQGRLAVDAATEGPPTPVVTAARSAAAWYRTRLVPRQTPTPREVR